MVQEGALQDRGPNSVALVVMVPKGGPEKGPRGTFTSSPALLHRARRGIGVEEGDLVLNRAGGGNARARESAR